MMNSLKRTINSPPIAANDLIDMAREEQSAGEREREAYERSDNLHRHQNYDKYLCRAKAYAEVASVMEKHKEISVRLFQSSIVVTDQNGKHFIWLPLSGNWRKVGSQKMYSSNGFEHFVRRYVLCIDGAAEDHSLSDGDNCPKCGAAMIIKKGKFGDFLSCSNFPSCKASAKISRNCASAAACSCGGGVENG